MSKFFGGKNPFDDPFFTQPFGGFFGANPFDHPFFAPTFGESSRRPITIEELGPDDDGVKNSGSGKEIIADSPTENTQRMGRSFMFQGVAYGGPEGTYYTCSESKMTGGDGVFFAEMKEEDKTIGESLHTISKGLRDKGHSMTTKDSSKGETSSIQTLHNLNEDELASFEDDWKSNADNYLPGWDTGFNLLENAGAANLLGWDGYPSWGGLGGWALPPSADYGDARTMIPADRERPKKVVSVKID